MTDEAKKKVLNTGAVMPKIGLGTWKSKPNEVGPAIEYALTECGYRHIDCAAAYSNEKEIGTALNGMLKNGKVKREEIFVTSKLWNVAHRKEDVRPACEQTLADLKLEHLDLYLMHWGLATKDEHRGETPVPVSIRETWEAMEKLVEAGLVKAIGVANFTGAMLLDLLTYAKIPPAVNQIELHPYLPQERLVAFCEKEGIAVTAYSPLGRPKALEAENFPLIIEDPVIGEIADAHGKTHAQVLLRWGIQRNTIVIPKSAHKERIRENINIFDFALSEKEMDRITALDRHLRFVDPYMWGKIPYFD